MIILNPAEARGVALRNRMVCWFSCGDPSAVAAALAIQEHGSNHEIIVARIRIENEHPDNDRFAADVSKWLDHPIVTLASERYKDCWEVWQKRRFLVGPKGALCTTEMKKMVRHEFQRADDVQVFGFYAGEEARAKRFREQNFEVHLQTPLIDRGLTAGDCHAIINRAGIKPAAMYELGYHNNNCVGCVKGGMGYWNKIRDDFPATFARMALVEREIGRSCIKGVFLDTLERGRGHYPSENEGECSLLCVGAENDIYAEPTPSQ